MKILRFGLLNSSAGDSEGVISTRSKKYVDDGRRGRCVAWGGREKLEADVGEVVFGGLLSSDPVETK